MIILKNIYKYNHSNELYYCNKKKQWHGMYLWQPVTKILFNIYKKSREPFWLDDYGFFKIN